MAEQKPSTKRAQTAKAADTGGETDSDGVERHPSEMEADRRQGTADPGEDTPDAEGGEGWNESVHGPNPAERKQSGDF